jgi:hypothetical protein
MCRNSLPSSQKTLSSSATKTSWLKLFREVIAVYYKNHTRHNFYEQSGEVVMLRQVVHILATFL